MLTDPHPVRIITIPGDSHERESLYHNTIDNSNDDKEAAEAIRIANSVRETWNSARQEEIAGAKLFENELIKNQMAAEIFAAITAYLQDIPSEVKDKVIMMLKSIPDDRKLITLDK